MSRLPADLLDRTPEEAARLLALSFLAEAEAARVRLDAPTDTEALHDFRVAVRRLRSCCRAYQAFLTTSVTRKLRRRLRGITEATNAGRDAEVLRGWVGSRRDVLGESAWAGADWLSVRFEERRAAGTGPAAADVWEEWEKLAGTLRRRLSEFSTVVRLGRGSRHPPFGRVAGGLVQEHAADLRARLAAVSGRDDAASAHRARISAKRLRYLIEPLARHGRAAAGFVERLKGLQDLLGDLRDRQVLVEEIGQAVEAAAAERARRLHHLALDGGGDDGQAARDGADEGPGLIELARVAREQADHLFQAVEAEWLAGHADPFLGRIERFGKSLARRRPRGAPVEIERKFLLTGLPERVRDAEASDVSQGWLPGRELHERIRRRRDARGETFTRTLKFGNGIRRTEIEEETTRDIFESLWPLTAGRRVEKRRYVMPEGELVCEVDEFRDRDLVLAEVELPAEDAEVEMPGWLRPYVEREVTGDPEFVNLNLAR